MAKIFGVIPARFGSTRFPGKPLVPILGRPLLAWVIEAARQSKLLDKVMVATDDPRIAQLASQCGVESVMTDSNLPSGSDRIWAATKNQPADIVINIQGDEPLIDGFMIDQVIRPLIEDRELQMATLAHPISLEELDSEHSVKVICNQHSDAIYFSRFPIPYSRIQPTESDLGAGAVLKHVGMYAFRKDFLGKYCCTPVAAVEKLESLEQLRALYLGARIRVIKIDQRSWGVDTPEDVAKIEHLLKSRGAK